jgi:hypothetical protein
MWKTLSDWLLAFLNMARELEENRASIRQIETRLRAMKEAIKLLAQAQRHGREMASTEREKLLLLLQQELAKFKPLPLTRGRKSG